MSEYYKTRESVADSGQTGAGQPVGMRQTRRFLLKNARITLRKTGMLKLFQSANNQASLVNLSRNGLQLLITEELKPNDNYQINLYPPGTGEPLSLKARVIWCKTHKIFYDRTYYRVGFRFTKLADDAARRLARLEAVC
ncbi:MAG: PilZ domain-containing protein [Desulfosudaceae bacterium]